MKSKFFNHPLTRLLVAILLLGGFLSIFILVSSSSGQVFELVVIGLRPSWKYAQILAWLGIALELVAGVLCASRLWAKAALVSTGVIVLSAAAFLARSVNFQYFRLEVWWPLLVFGGCLALRVIQLRQRRTSTPVAVPAIAHS